MSAAQLPALKAAIDRMINIWKEQVYPNAQGRDKFLTEWVASVNARIPEGSDRERLLNMAAGARTLYVDAITPQKTAPVEAAPAEVPVTAAAPVVAAPVPAPAVKFALPEHGHVDAPARLPQVARPAPVPAPVAAPAPAPAPAPELAANATEIWEYIQMLLDVVNSNAETFKAVADVAPAGARDTLAAGLRTYSSAHTTFRTVLEAAAGKVFDGGMNDPAPAENARPDWEGADDDDEDD